MRRIHRGIRPDGIECVFYAIILRNIAGGQPFFPRNPVVSTSNRVPYRRFSHSCCRYPILCGAYRDRHGQDPSRVEPPVRVRYQPPSEVRRPQDPVAAAWYDRITTEAFPMILAKGASHPRPVLPEPSAPIVVGGVTLNVGSGGLHSVDRPALHRSTSEYIVLETDVASYYPSMMASFGIVPRSLGDCGADLFAEILAERIKIKAQAAAESDPAESQRLKVQSHGLKIVLNSVFGQCGNPYSVLYDPTAFLAVTLTGQLMLIDLLERLDSAGAEILSVNTDGLCFKVRRTGDAWRGALADWQEDTGMVLETAPVEALLIEAANHYAIMHADGRVKRRGNLSDVVSWRNVPNATIVADAVVAGLLDGVLPERTVRAVRGSHPVREHHPPGECKGRGPDQRRDRDRGIPAQAGPVVQGQG